MTAVPRPVNGAGDLRAANWRAVGAATAAHYMLGALWFSRPTLGKQWARAIGLPADYRADPVSYLGPLAGSFLASVATAALARATGAKTLSEGLSLGLLVGSGYGVGLSATYAVSPNNQQPGRLLAITGAYQLVGCATVGAIVTAWRGTSRS